MSQITKYVLVFFILISVAESSLANEDPSLCTNVLPEYEITYSESSINYRLDKRARELRAEFEANEYTLGYFHSNLNVEKKGTFTTFTDQNKKCTDLTGLKLKLSFNPTIYITKEAQTFRCTFDRTIKHEHTHYKIEKSAFLLLLKNIDVLVKKNFDDFNTSEFSNNDSELDKRINLLMDDINSLLESYTKVQHALLDTEENYENEAKVCLPHENKMLDRLFEMAL